MSKQFTVAIIGCGNRGFEVYGATIKNYLSDKFKVVAVCDAIELRANRCAEQAGIGKDAIYYDEDKFFEKKLADVLIVASQDRDHVRMALKGLELGYDILCEKPITGDKDECITLLEAQKKAGKKFFVSHVLRYAPAFVKTKEIIDSGRIGKLLAIESLEQVFFGHFAHSFVRGNWRDAEETSPIILAKTCHDMDLLQWYAGSNCKSLSSMGDLSYFKAESAPKDATKRCLDCPHADTCCYSAKKIYIDRWKKNPEYNFTKIACSERPLTEEAIRKSLTEGPYGRCVFYCDNNVCDNQLTTMTFENGIHASLSLMAFTTHGGRVMRFHGSHGDLILDEDRDEIKVGEYGIGYETIKISDLNESVRMSHGGGDLGILTTLYDMLLGNASGETTLERSIESHLMCYAAEASRLEGGALKYVHN